MDTLLFKNFCRMPFIDSFYKLTYWERTTCNLIASPPAFWRPPSDQWGSWHNKGQNGAPHRSGWSEKLSCSNCLCTCLSNVKSPSIQSKGKSHCISFFFINYDLWQLRYLSSFFHVWYMTYSFAYWAPFNNTICLIRLQSVVSRNYGRNHPLFEE